MRPRELLSAVAGMAALALAVLGVGGAFRWVQAIVALLLIIAAAPHVLSRRAATRISPLVLVIAIAGGLTVLQLVPLPAGLLAWLNPTGQALREDGARLLETSPWQGLSLDAPGTLAAVCFFLLLLGSAYVALRMSMKESGRYRVLVAVGAVCGFTALVATLHKIVGAGALYGIYTPSQARPSILGPLLNENHLGALMAVGTTTALALTFHRNQSSRVRVMWLGVTLLCGCVTLLTQSRGAAIALAGGFIVSGGVIVGQRMTRDDAFSRKSGFATSTLPIGVVVAAAMVVVLYASAGGVSQQLENTSFGHELQNPRSKVAIWKSTIQLIEESPWVGVGRGAFESAFTRHHPAAALNSFSHVENEYLQTVADWGIPGTILIAAAFGWLLFTCFRRWRDGSLIAAPLGTIAVVGIQAALDFGMEMIGVAIPVTMVIATAAYTPYKEVERKKLLRGRVAVGALCIALLGASIALFSPVTANLVEDHERIAAKDPLELADLQRLAARHPLDYLAYAKASELFARKGDPREVLLLNHALRLHPTLSTLHRLAARLLLRNGRPEQAAIEYSLALQTTLSLRPLLTEITTRLSPELAARALPVDFPEFRTMTELLAELGKPQIARAWLLRILDQRPEDLSACEWLFATAISSRDLDSGLAATARCMRAAPSYEARMDLARLLLSRQRTKEAKEVLGDVENWRGRVDTRAAAWLFLCDAYIAEAKWDEAKRCLRRLDVTGTVPPAEQAGLARRLAEIDEAMRKASAP